MATLARRGTGTPTTTGTTWATTTNAVDGAAGTNPATYATMTNAVSAAVATIEVTGYSFSDTIASVDTLNSVSVSLRHFENNTGRFASVTFQAFDGATAIGTATTCTLATAARTDTATVAATLTQLRSSTFKIRCTITGAASTQSRVFSIDQIDVTADYTPLPATITQAAYRWYDDGTETGSVALAAQDTAATGDVSVNDGIGMLRVRMQSTNAGVIAATDDWQLQYQKTAATPTPADSYLSTNFTTNQLLSGVNSAVSQSFLGNGLPLTRAGFYLSKVGTPTGTLTARLYAHTGTFGTASSPTGSALATSTTTVVSTSLSTTPTMVYFDFDGTYTPTNGTPYCITVATDTATNTSNCARAGSDTSSPTHAGNLASGTIGGSWIPDASDLIFEVYTTSPWNNVVPLLTLIDTYPETNGDTNTTIGAGGGTTTSRGQSFLGTGVPLNRVDFSLLKNGTPGGSLVAEVFAHTGTFGTTGIPTGAALATSTNSIVSTSLPTTTAWQTFNFDGSFTPTNGTPYFVALRVTAQGGGPTDYVAILADNSSPTHAGNEAIFQSSAWSTTTPDLCFRLYNAPGASTVLPYNSANLTDAAATTNRLTGGSGTFVAGKISETGLVSDLGWSVNNYTELVYSLDIVNTDVANGDTLGFRVLRKAATTGLTYTQVPTINLVKAGGAVALAGQSDGVSTTTGALSRAVPLDASGAGAAILDDFNRADGAPGSNWAINSGNYAISSNTLARQAGTNDWANWVTPMASADHFVEADISGYQAGAYAVIHARADGATTGAQYNYSAFLAPDPPGTYGVYLGKNVAGGYSDVWAVAYTKHAAPTKLRLECQGTAIQVYVDGALLINVTDTSVDGSQGNYIGVNSNTSTCWYDNFNGGTLPVATGGGASGVATAGGDTLTTTRGAITLAGQADGVSTTTGSRLDLARPLAATVPGISTTTGALIGAISFAGSATGTATTTGALVRAVALAGTTGGGFGAEQRPTIGTGASNSFNSNLELAVVCTFARAGRITKMRYNRGSGMPATVAVALRIWSDTGTLLLGPISDSQGAGTTGYFTVTLPTPLAVAAGQKLVFAYGAGGALTFQYPGPSESATGTTDITVNEVDRWISSFGSYPNANFGGTTYLEPIYEPGTAGGGTSTVTGDLTVSAIVIEALAGQSDGIATTTGALAVARPLAGRTDGTTGGSSITATLLEPFDSFANWSTSANWTIAAGRTGTCAQSTTSSSTTNYTIPSLQESDTILVGFAWQATALSANQPVLVLLSDSGATFHLALNANANGSMSVRRGSTAGTLLGSASTAGVLTINTWYYIEIKAVLSDTVGSIEVHVNGSTVIGPTGSLDTKNAGTKTTFDTVRITQTAITTTARYDDMYVAMGAGTSFLGDLALPLPAGGVTGALSVTRGLAASSATGVATADATALTVTRGLAAASANGVATATATTMTAAQDLGTGSATGVATATASGMVAVKGLASTSANGTSNATATMLSADPLAGLATGSGSATGGLIVVYQLAASATGVATTTGTLTATSASGIAGNIDGTSTTTGALSVTHTLAASSATGTATTTGALAGARPLAAASATGSSSTTGALAVARPLIGRVDGVSTVSATTLRRALALVGSTPGAATTTGSLTTTAPTAPQMKVWNGTTFVTATVKVWNGTAFVDAVAVKTYNGTSFV